MEFGDLIYFILVIAFMVLGFFNDARKRKKRKMEREASTSHQDSQKQSENQHKVEDSDDWWRNLPKTPPIPTTKKPTPYVRKEFQSSLDLVTNFEGESSLKDSIFVQDAAFTNIYEEKRRRKQSPPLVHPLVRDLLNDSGNKELKKGLIYGEILQRKY
ncbi:MAG: hypothetical protein LBI15_11920 [Dysgonamonadaceae bacterium]|jgi:hypothetical protein|nr:hypothetical protein [Dysgonamonadaceae bacterium]